MTEATKAVSAKKETDLSISETANIKTVLKKHVNKTPCACLHALLYLPNKFLTNHQTIRPAFDYANTNFSVIGVENVGTMAC